jgi:hypothetical protein
LTYLRTQQTRNSAPRVTPPHHTHHPGRVKPSQPPPSPPPRCGGHRVVAGTHARAQRSAVSLRAHFTAILKNGTDKQHARERETSKHRKVLWQGTWFQPPLRTQHAPSAADHARGLTQSGHEKLGGGGGRRNPPCAGVRLHSVVAAPRRTCDKATKPRLGRTSPTFLRAAAGHTVMNTGGGPIGVLPARGKSRDWAQRSTKVPRRCHSSRAWVPERADGVQDHG